MLKKGPGATPLAEEIPVFTLLGEIVGSKGRR